MREQGEQLVIATHIIMTGYGHWLPNDPRGSMSQQVYSPDIATLGEIPSAGVKEEPSADRVSEFRKKSRDVLSHPLRWFSRADRDAIAQAIHDVLITERLVCYACAILPSHIHILIRRHRLRAQQVSPLLKDSIRQRLRGHSFECSHPVMSGQSAHYFKSSQEMVWQCIAYIERNFERHSLPLERYPFVTAYDGWLPHG